jgi:gluconolactonase
VFALTPEGELRILLDDAPVEASQRLMEAFYRGQATPELMLACGGTIAPWMASLTFFGKDLRQVAIGSLRGTNLPTFTAPVAGLPMAHWNDPPVLIEGS